MKLRALNEPRPIRVRASDEGRPQAVMEGSRSRRVEVVRECWRIDDEWWRRPISRLYFSVVLENGKSLTLFQDLVQGGWFVQG
jgi:hypothetical protein